MIDGTKYKCEIDIENPKDISMHTNRQVYFENISIGVFFITGKNFYN